MSHQILSRRDAPDLAYHYTPPAAGFAGPVVVFCGGYRSDMDGTKAIFLEEQCRARGQGYLRFDYRGHGRSGGDFIDGTIGLWRDDARAVIEAVLPQDVPLLIVGSSMGGWIALLLARDLGPRVVALIGIAAAPDFTRALYNERLDDEGRAAMMRDGYVAIPNDYSDEPYTYTRALYEDGENHCLLDTAPQLSCRVCLIQGMKDIDVPWQTAHRIKNALVTPAEPEVLLVESGDHRLSRPEDLSLLDEAVRRLSDRPG